MEGGKRVFVFSYKLFLIIFTQNTKNKKLKQTSMEKIRLTCTRVPSSEQVKFTVDCIIWPVICEVVWFDEKRKSWYALRFAQYSTQTYKLCEKTEVYFVQDREVERITIKLCCEPGTQSVSDKNFKYLKKCIVSYNEHFVKKNSTDPNQFIVE